MEKTIVYFLIFNFYLFLNAKQVQHRFVLVMYYQILISFFVFHVTCL